MNLFKYERDYETGVSVWCDEIDDSPNDGDTLIKFEEGEQVIKWNKVEDGLPKDKGEILVYFGSQNVYMLVFWHSVYKCWINKGEPKMGIENNVTHWAELPKPKEA